MVIDNLERLNKAFISMDTPDLQLDVCSPIEYSILKHYTTITGIVDYVYISLQRPPDIIYTQCLTNVLFHDTRANPKQELVCKQELSLARSLHGAELLREANEKLAESKKPRKVRDKKPVTVEDVTALLDGLDPAVIASIMAKHTKKE